MSDLTANWPTTLFFANNTLLSVETIKPTDVREGQCVHLGALLFPLFAGLSLRRPLKSFLFSYVSAQLSKVLVSY